MIKKKYLIQCRFCGNLLMKTEIVSIFNTEIKCPQCKKKLTLPDDVIITLDKGAGRVKIK